MEAHPPQEALPIRPVPWKRSALFPEAGGDAAGGGGESAGRWERELETVGSGAD
jgi:hypothetical protein